MTWIKETPCVNKQVAAVIINIDYFFLLSCCFLYQWTPLHTAAARGHDYTVICLIKNGADINIKDKNGVSVTVFLTIDMYC